MTSTHQLTHLYDSNNDHVSLGDQVGSGKQGTVYLVDSHPGMVAKVFHEASLDEGTHQKLQAMLSTQPPITRCAAFTIAWPQLVIRGPKNHGKTIGYTMSLFPHQHFHEVGAYFNPARRRRLLQNRKTGYTYLHLLAIARNLTQAVAHLHAQGHLIGDLNSRNILVSDRAQVALIDTDSYQIHDPRTNSIHPCRVGTPEYMPPNLQGIQLAQAKRTETDDLFSLAIMIYQLLFQGQHPFSGILKKGSQQPELTNIADKIGKGQFIHLGSDQDSYQPTPQSHLIWTDLPLKRQMNATLSKRGGTATTAARWMKAIEDATQHIKQCRINPLHSYFGKRRCTWCRYQEETSLRPFPEPSHPSITSRS